MADTSRENINNQREYNDLLGITTSLISEINDDMSSLQKKSDKRNKTLSNEVDITKEILESLEDEEDITNTINKLKSQTVNISEKNLGVNEKLKNAALQQITAAQGLLQNHVMIGNEISVLEQKMDNFTNSITGALGGLVSMVDQIPVLGGLINSFLEPLIGNLTDTIQLVGMSFKEGFVESFGQARMASSSFASSFSAGLAGGIAKAKALGPLLSNPFTAAAVAAAALFALATVGFFQIAQSVEAFRQETGLLANDTQQLGDNISSVVMDTAQLGVGFEDVQNAASAFTQEFDNIEQASSAVLKSMTVLNKNFGVSLDTSAKVNKIFSTMSGSSSETAQSMVQMVTEASDLVGVAPQKVLEDIAENSEVAFQFFGGSVSELAAAAVEAEKLGTSIGQAAEVADKLIEFESSINSELQLSALLGQRVNFNRARSLAFQGEALEAQKEVVNQVGRLGDLTEMNRIQQQAIVDATGMELSDLIRQQQIKSRFGNLERTQLSLVQERLAAGEALGDITKQQLDDEAEALERRREVTSLFTELGDMLSAAGIRLITLLAPFAQGILEPILNSFRQIGDALREFGALFGGVNEDGEVLRKTLQVIGEILGGSIAIAVNTITFSIGLLTDLIEYVLGMVSSIATIWKGIFTGDLSEVQLGFQRLGDTIIDFFKSITMRVIDAIFGVFENTTIGNFFDGLFGNSDESVNDGVIQNGKVISTNPADTLIATKNPQALTTSGGGGTSSQLAQEIKGLREDLRSGKVAVYMDGKKVTGRVANVVNKVSTNSYAL